MNRVIKKIIRRIIYPNKWSSDAYIKYLKKKKCQVGDDTFFFKPESNTIDDGRLEYITIGNSVKITEGVKILAHDYSWVNLIESSNAFFPSGGRKVVIGNNVFIGMNSIIIGPCTIGDNVIIGANTVVTKDIPSNTVVGGSPARTICSISEYYKKRENELLIQCRNEYACFRNNKERDPSINESGYFMLLFLERNEQNYETYVKKLNFEGVNKRKVRECFFSSKPIIEGGYKGYLKMMKKKDDL